MSIFAIADLHLSLGTDKPMDVFKGWDHYVERLERNWRSLVGPDDLVVVPGDVSWAMSLEQTKADFAFLHALPGRKLIGKGNHDYWWCTKRKMDAFLAECGFDSIEILFNNAFAAEGIAVCGTRGWFFDAAKTEDRKILLREAGRLRMSIEQAVQNGKEPVVFLHYPPLYAGEVCEEMMQVLKEYGIRRVYYGHIHGHGARRAVTGEYEGIVFRLISCDFLGFCPERVEGGW